MQSPFVLFYYFLCRLYVFILCDMQCKFFFFFCCALIRLFLCPHTLGFREYAFFSSVASFVRTTETRWWVCVSACLISCTQYQWCTIVIAYETLTFDACSTESSRNLTKTFIIAVNTRFIRIFDSFKFWTHSLSLFLALAFSLYPALLLFRFNFSSAFCIFISMNLNQQWADFVELHWI